MNCIRIKTLPTQIELQGSTTKHVPRCQMIELQLDETLQEIYNAGIVEAKRLHGTREQTKFIECLAFMPNLYKAMTPQRGTAGLWRASSGLTAMTNRSSSSAAAAAAASQGQESKDPGVRSRESMESDMAKIVDGGLRFFYSAMQGGDSMMWPFPSCSAAWAQWLCCNSPILSATISIIEDAISQADLAAILERSTPPAKRILVIVPDNSIIRLLMVVGIHLASFQVKSLHQNASGPSIKDTAKWFTNRQDQCSGVLVTRLKEAEKLRAAIMVSSLSGSTEEFGMTGLSMFCRHGIIVQPPISSQQFLRILALLPESSSVEWRCLSVKQTQHDEYEFQL
ncbi:hypothetical protein F5Y09DRAFT_326284 [Xylaria sp. FL1042]|nr:hypothetical protein F5Y09DRAFT_326284 [Xylaria sp. FL1042]